MKRVTETMDYRPSIVRLNRVRYYGPSYDQVAQVIENLKIIPALNTAAYMLMVPFIPFRTGRLIGNVTMRDRGFSRGEIIFKTWYALKCYQGVGFNFRKWHHPLATAYWAQAMRAARGHELGALVQERIRRNRR